MPPLIGTFFTLIGIKVPVVFPVGATVVLATVLFMMPSRDVKEEAKKARANFARALSAYIELCALERNSGAGATVALANAAAVGDSWVFRKINEELARSRYNGIPPWDSLKALSEDLGLPELAELADIMRLANDESSEVYRHLRARSASARSALMSTELAQASLVEERMYVPAAFLGLVFLGLLITPPLLRLLAAS
jgi:Flp pilus assembly protein TadB